MITFKTGDVFSIDYINSEPIPDVPKHLIPWLIKDRKEALEGCFVKSHKGTMEHDGTGLQKAERSLRSAQAALKEPDLDDQTREFLTLQLGMAEGKAGFYRGKIHLLDRIIAKHG